MVRVQGESQARKLSRPRVVCVFLLLAAIAHAGGKKAPKPATGQQNSYMLGRIVSAIEDEGCCLNEALRKLEHANDDLDKLEYPARTRWLAHYWYAKVLLEKRNTQKANMVLPLVEQDAQSLSPKEQDDTAKLAQEIQARNR